MSKKKAAKSEKNISSWISSRLKRLEWQDYVLIAFLLLIILINYSNFTQLKHLPSPLYGGDTYRDRGFIQNIVDGNPIWSDAYYLDEINYYAWGGVAFYAGLVKLTGANIETFMIFFGLILQAIYGLTYYLLGKEIFKKKELALILVAASQLMALFLMAKPVALTTALTVPLFFLFWISHEKKQSLWKGAGTGAMLGLTALIYGGRFVILLGIFCITLLIKFILDLRKEGFLPTLKEYIKKYLYIFIIAGAIAAIFFLPLIIEYNFHIYNPVTKYGDVSPENMGLGWLIKHITGTFFNTSSIPHFILGIIGLIGGVHCALNFRRTEQKMVLLWFFASMLLIEHHLITRPLFDTWFNTAHLIFTKFPFMLFQVYGFKEIYKNIKKIKLPVKPEHALLILVLVLLVFPYIKTYNNYHEDMWIQYGERMDPSTQAMYDMANWARQNIGKDETVLSHDETGFAVAVLSGRKVVISRRTHATYFVDTDRRIAEVAAAMYGNDPSEMERVFKEYKAGYFFQDGQLFRTPMRTRLDQKEYLDKYGVEYTIQKSYWDHANTKSMMFDFIYIPSQNFSQSFQDALIPEAAFGPQASPLGVMYKLNYTR